MPTRCQLLATEQPRGCLGNEKSFSFGHLSLPTLLPSNRQGGKIKGAETKSHLLLTQSRKTLVLVDEYSLAAVSLELRFESQTLSSGTAFFWKKDGRLFLVTNWHVLTGMNPFTGQPISEHGGQPDHLIVRMQARFFSGSQPIEARVPRLLQLRDAASEPRWLVHPEYGKLVDVAVLPVEESPLYSPSPINDMSTTSVPTTVGSDVFVLGYPLSRAAIDGFPISAAKYPIWKRGSIASEPQVGDDDEPILIDTASRPGMSGSPVIRRSPGNVVIGAMRSMSPDHTQLLGLYSGRLTTNDPLDAQLGLVWRIALVEQIIAGGCFERLQNI